jgi:hypothetical protein
MRNSALIPILLALGACAPPPKPAEQPKPDPTAEAWYAPAALQLTAMARDAEAAYRAHRNADASKIITDSQPLAARLLAAPHPTLEAMEGASDLDDLYGRMLMADKRYGWARLQFQKNVTRWRYWQPRSPESDRRLKAAQDAIAQCDKNL